jgi:hypothetical protein
MIVQRQQNRMRHLGDLLLERRRDIWLLLHVCAKLHAMPWLPPTDRNRMPTDAMRRTVPGTDRVPVPVPPSSITPPPCGPPDLVQYDCTGIAVAARLRGATAEQEVACLRGGGV